jgi:hypothetical protein
MLNLVYNCVLIVFDDEVNDKYVNQVLISLFLSFYSDYFKVFMCDKKYIYIIIYKYDYSYMYITL